MVSEKTIFQVLPVYLFEKLSNTEAGQFLPRGHDMNKFGRVPTDNAVYQKC